MNTTTKPLSPTNPSYYLDALEKSEKFELFRRARGGNNSRYAIHKATGLHGLIWFIAQEGNWSKRQGLVVRMSMQRQMHDEIPRKAQLALENYSSPKEVLGHSAIEKTFLPEEMDWGLKALEATLLGDGNYYEVSTNASLVHHWLRGDGRYSKLRPGRGANNQGKIQLTTASQLRESFKELDEFAANLFALWHGEVSSKQAKEFAAFNSVDLNWEMIDRCSPHLAAMRKETYGLKSKVNSGKASWGNLMFGADGFKDRLTQIVGYEALHPALRSERVYDWVMDFFLKKTGY